MSVTAVIVTYNSADVIGPCLDSLGNLPVIVADNASTDKTAAQIKTRKAVRFFENQQNLGFASAANQAIAASDTPFILLLNPDVQLQTSIQPLLDALTDPQTALAAGQLIDSNRTPQTGFTFRRLPTPTTLIFEVLGLNSLLPQNPINRRYRCLDFDLTQPAIVEQPAGAFLLFRRSLWEYLQGFDAQFHPIWYEDVDFSKRALDAGYLTRYVPQVKALHQGGNSIEKLRQSTRQRYWYGSLLRYAYKHYRRSAFQAVSAAVVLRSGIGALVAALEMREKEFVRTYAGISRFAAQCAFRGTIPGLPEVSFQTGNSRVREIKSSNSTR